MSSLLSSGLSQNFHWDEVTATQHRNIDNTLPDNLRANVRFTATKLESLRVLLGSHPISINSWYRSPALNEAVGGSKNSAHMSGCAVDFICPKFGSPLEVCLKINRFANLIGFDQLIYEHTWTHIGFSVIPGAKAKLQVLTLLSSGKYAVGITDKSGNAIIGA